MIKPGVKRVFGFLDSTVKLMFSFITVQVVFIFIYFTQVHLYSLDIKHLVFYFSASREIPLQIEKLVWAMYVVDGIAMLVYYISSRYLRRVYQNPGSIKVSLFTSWLLFFLMHQILLIVALDIIALFKISLASIQFNPYAFVHIILRIVSLLLLCFASMQKKEYWKWVFSLESRNFGRNKSSTLKAHLLISWFSFFLLFFVTALLFRKIEWVLYILFLNIVFIPVLAFLPNYSPESFSKQ